MVRQNKKLHQSFEDPAVFSQEAKTEEEALDTLPPRTRRNKGFYFEAA